MLLRQAYHLHMELMYASELVFMSNSLQGKQRLLYSLLDAMQSVSSQAVVIGVSCRLVC